MRNHSDIFKVAIIGPESTGKSTLAERLGEHYQTASVKEYARTYLDTFGTNYTYQDLLTIAQEQVKDENKAYAATTKTLVIMDTNLYVVKVWAEYVFSKCHRWILDQIAEREYSLYLLMDIDIPWVADNMREYPDEKPRQELFYYYKELLTQQKTAWHIVSGGYEERIQRSIAYIDAEIKNQAKKI